MNVSLKKADSFKTPKSHNSHNSSFTPGKRFPITSPSSIISNAKNEVMNDSDSKKSNKKTFYKPSG